MNLDTFEKLKLKNLNTSYVPTLKGATGHDMLAKGIATNDICINDCIFSNSFIVCTRQSRPIILGDFTIPNTISISWTRQRTKKLWTDGEVVMECQKNFKGKRLALSRSIRIPLHCTAVAEVTCAADMKEKFQVQPSPVFLRDNPNIYCKPLVYDMTPVNCWIQQNPSSDSPDTSVNTVMEDGWNGQIPSPNLPIGIEVNNIEPMNILTSPSNRKMEKEDKHQQCAKIPFFITNLSSTSRLVLPKDHAMAFITPENPETNYVEVSEVQSVEEHCKNWVAPHKLLPKIPDNSDFMVSPGDVKEVRKCVLSESDISDETQKISPPSPKVSCGIFSTSSEDIGHTELINMDIDMGLSKPVSQRLYTLLLKHHDWVRKEIEQLKHAGVIEKSLNPWVSLIIIVPKKSAPGEPPKQCMCVDYRWINALQTEVNSSSKGCMSLYPFPKIDKMFAKLHGAKIFTTLDLCSGYYHIGLSEEAKPKTTFITPAGKWHFNVVPFGLAQAPSYFQQLMNKVLQGLDCVVAYLDDIDIFSKNELEHLEHQEIIFKRLQEAGLKLKESKCDFFWAKIHYLWYMLSADGIWPLPEKLDSITNMPPPENQTKVKQFLGLVGYYCKFVPHFLDISRPLAKLMRKDTLFTWTKQCDLTFNMLKDELCKTPILQNPESNKPYTLFTDASKHGCAGMLTQEFETEVKGKVLKELHPVAYISGLFWGSQLNWVALTKEAYAIYLSIKELSFYVIDADITLRSDHLPLKHFLLKNTLNAKVNKWAVELETYRIKFVHIKGKSNVLADTLSRLINPELAGYEFGHLCFEELLKASSYTVNEVIADKVVEAHDADINEIVTTYTIPLPSPKIWEMQESDEKLCHLCPCIEKGHLAESGYFIDLEDGLLQWRIIDNLQTFKPVVLPNSLISTALLLAHDYPGYNGFRHMYAPLKRLYYWNGIRKDVLMCCKHCQTCAKQWVEKSKYIKDNFRPGCIPMEFISMDLVGRFTRTTDGHEYALTVICMLTGYVFCIPLKMKTAEEIVEKYLTHVSFMFGVSRKILSGNGTEFKNSLFEEVAKQLGVECKIYCPVYRSQANGRIEGSLKVSERVHFKTFGEEPRMGQHPASSSCSLQLVPKWTLKRTLILLDVWARCGNTFHWI